MNVITKPEQNTRTLCTQKRQPELNFRFLQTSPTHPVILLFCGRTKKENLEDRRTQK